MNKTYFNFTSAPAAVSFPSWILHLLGNAFFNSFQALSTSSFLPSDQASNLTNSDDLNLLRTYRFQDNINSLFSSAAAP